MRISGTCPYSMRRPGKIFFILLMSFVFRLPAAAQEGGPDGEGPAVPAESGSGTAAADDGSAVEPRTISIVPMIAEEAPGYTALVLTKLVQQNFDRTEALTSSLLSDDVLPAEEGLSVYEDPAALVDALGSLGRQNGSRYVVAGTITRRGTQFRIKMIVVDAENGREVLTEEKTAIGLEDLDRLVRGVTDSLIAKEFPAVVQEKVQEMRKTEAQENARIRDDLAALEVLAEEDPEEAIKKLPETVQRAVTEKAKEQVVKEEIEQLYEQEKKETQAARLRKWQRYGMLTSYGFRFVSDMTLDMSIQSRIRSLRSWSLYMNDYLSYDSYEEYRHFHESSNGMVISSYILGSLGSGGLAYANMYMLDDVIEIRKGSRELLALANTLYLSGRGLSYISGSLGYFSMDMYDRYIGEHSNPSEISDRYDTYRNWHLVYEISRYTSLSLQLAGAAGIAAIYFWPGEKEQLILSDQAGFQLGLSNILSGAGAICGQVAINLYAQGIESSIKARSPSGNPDADVSMMFNTYAVTFGMGAIALYTTSAVIADRAIRNGLSSADGAEAARTDRRTLPFAVAVVPAPAGGMTVAFEVRR